MRNIMISLSLGLICLFYPYIATACSCYDAGKFVDYVAGGKAIKGRVISYGDKLSHGETLYVSMHVEVIDVVKGEFKPKHVVFLGDPGDLCRDYVDSTRFKLGDEFLFAVYGDEKTLELGGCGESSISIKDGKVHGVDWVDYEPVAYEINYDEFIEILNSPKK